MGGRAAVQGAQADAPAPGLLRRERECGQVEISLWGVELRTRFGKTKSIITRKENPQRKISRYGSDEHSYGMVVIRFYKKVNIHTKSAHPAERIEPPRTRPAPEPSPEQPAALGLELLDLLAQLVLAAFEILGETRQAPPEAPLRDAEVDEAPPCSAKPCSPARCKPCRKPLPRRSRRAPPARPCTSRSEASCGRATCQRNPWPPPESASPA